MTLDQLHARLQSYLAHHGDRQWSLGPLVSLTVGWDSSLYVITAHPRHTLHTGQRADPNDALATKWVLKLYTADARGRVHAIREWRALTYLRDVDYPVPRVILVEPDASHLGRPFLLMEHIPCRSLWTAYEDATPAARADLTQSFAQQLLALHSLDPQPLERTAAAMSA